MELTPEEIRVLGCLIEKGATTPDQYPLSTNALTTACNQKTSRDPVVGYSERMVAETMLLLRPAGLARTITSGRTEKHRHVLDEAWSLGPEELAVLAIMMLRGPQSPGELRTRTERYVAFESLDDVERALHRLRDRNDPLVVDLGRGPGQSQNRWMHTLGATSGAASGPANEPSAGDTAIASGAAAQASASDPTNEVSVGNTAVATALGGGDSREGANDLAARVTELEERLARIERELGL